MASLNLAQLVGIGIGSSLGFMLGCACVWLFLRRRRKPASQDLEISSPIPLQDLPTTAHTLANQDTPPSRAVETSSTLSRIDHASLVPSTYSLPNGFQSHATNLQRHSGAASTCGGTTLCSHGSFRSNRTFSRIPQRFSENWPPPHLSSSPSLSVHSPFAAGLSDSFSGSSFLDSSPLREIKRRSTMDLVVADRLPKVVTTDQILGTDKLSQLEEIRSMTGNETEPLTVGLGRSASRRGGLGSIAENRVVNPRDLELLPESTKYFPMVDYSATFPSSAADSPAVENHSCEVASGHDTSKTSTNAELSSAGETPEILLISGNVSNGSRSSKSAASTRTFSPDYSLETNDTEMNEAWTPLTITSNTMSEMSSPFNSSWSKGGSLSPEPSIYHNTGISGNDDTLATFPVTQVLPEGISSINEPTYLPECSAPETANPTDSEFGWLDLETAALDPRLSYLANDDTTVSGPPNISLGETSGGFLQTAPHQTNSSPAGVVCSTINTSCSQCDFEGKTRAELNAHINRRHNRRFRCSRCTRVFNLRTDLTRHRNTVHKDAHPASNIYRCSNDPCISPGTEWIRKDHYKRHKERCDDRLHKSR